MLQGARAMPSGGHPPMSAAGPWSYMPNSASLDTWPNPLLPMIHEMSAARPRAIAVARRPAPVCRSLGKDGELASRSTSSIRPVMMQMSE